MLQHFLIWFFLWVTFNCKPKQKNYLYWLLSIIQDLHPIILQIFASNTTAHISGFLVAVVKSWTFKKVSILEIFLIEVLLLS